MKVNILTKGFSSQNASAFLYPVLKFKRALRDLNVRVALHAMESPELIDCDTLILESSYFRSDWSDKTSEIIEKLKSYKSQVKRLLYFDVTDSSGIPHMRALPCVDGYFKSYLLKERKHYLKPLYGFRLYTDYYHKQYDVVDADAATFEAVKEPALLNKLGVSWCSGFAHYDFWGKYQLALYRRLPLSILLSLPERFYSPARPRAQAVSCRINTNYSRNTIAYQRKKTASCLKQYAAFSKVSRRRYFNELASSQLVVSPFGFGEVCYRDYEAILSGALLLKPDMSHMETWPAIFRKDETLLTYRWDLDDLETLVDDALSNYSNRRCIAESAQTFYQEQLSAPQAGEAFAQHFLNIVS